MPLKINLILLEYQKCALKHIIRIFQYKAIIIHSTFMALDKRNHQKQQFRGQNDSEAQENEDKALSTKSLMCSHLKFIQNICCILFIQSLT